jgi:hypothetical protein
VGLDTRCRVLPRARVLDAGQAAAMAAGATVHKVFGVEPVKRRIIDRVPAVLAQGIVKPATVQVKEVHQRIGGRVAYV